MGTHDDDTSSSASDDTTTSNTSTSSGSGTGSSELSSSSGASASTSENTSVENSGESTTNSESESGSTTQASHSTESGESKSALKESSDATSVSESGDETSSESASTSSSSGTSASSSSSSSSSASKSYTTDKTTIASGGIPLTSPRPAKVAVELTEDVDAGDAILDIQELDYEVATVLKSDETRRWNWRLGTWQADVKGSWRAFFGEFIGSMLLVFFGCGSVVSTAYSPVGSSLDMTYIALAFGFAVTVIVYGLANISGGHVNSAVTLAIVATGRMPLLSAIFYVISQIAGSTAGAMLLWTVFPQEVGDLSAFGAPGLATYTIPTIGLWEVTVGQAFMAELLGTFVLIWTVFATADIQGDSKDMGKFAPLAIGLAVFLGVGFAGPISGGAINPSRALGAAIAGRKFDNHWIYWLAPILGGQIAGWVYTIAFISKSDRKKSAFYSARNDLEHLMRKGKPVCLDDVNASTKKSSAKKGKKQD